MDVASLDVVCMSSRLAKQAQGGVACSFRADLAPDTRATFAAAIPNRLRPLIHRNTFPKDYDHVEHCAPSFQV